MGECDGEQGDAEKRKSRGGLLEEAAGGSGKGKVQNCVSICERFLKFVISWGVAETLGNVHTQSHVYT